MSALRRTHPLARLILLAAIVGAAFVKFVLLGGPGDTAHVRSMVGTGPWAVAAFIAIAALLTVALFPGPVLAGAAGLLFGVAWGTLIAIVSATLGAVLAFGVARLLAGDSVERLGGRRTRAAAAWIGERGFVAVLYARIAPGVPYTLVNYAAGLSPVTLGAFAAATLIGCAPRAFAYAALGGSLHDLTSAPALAAGGVLVAMALLGLLLAWRRRPASQLLDL